MAASSQSECSYCTKQLGSRVYRHEKGKHPEPRPAFCSISCVGYYENRRQVEKRAFLAHSIIGMLAQLGILAWALA